MEVAQKAPTVRLATTAAAAAGSEETSAATNQTLTTCLLSLREAACFKPRRLHVTLNPQENLRSVALHDSPVYSIHQTAAALFLGVLFRIKISAPNNFAAHAIFFLLPLKKIQEKVCCSPGCSARCRGSLGRPQRHFSPEPTAA